MIETTEHDTMRKAVSTWNRWRKWFGPKRLNPKDDMAYYRPAATQLRAFLAEVNRGGATAAVGVMASLRWLRRHLGLESIPTENQIVTSH